MSEFDFNIIGARTKYTVDAEIRLHRGGKGKPQIAFIFSNELLQLSGFKLDQKIDIAENPTTGRFAIREGTNYSFTPKSTYAYLRVASSKLNYFIHEGELDWEYKGGLLIFTYKSTKSITDQFLRK